MLGEGPPTPHHTAQGFTQCFCSRPTDASKPVFFPNARVGLGDIARPGKVPPRHLFPRKVDSQTPNCPHCTYRNYF